MFFRHPVRPLLAVVALSGLLFAAGSAGALTEYPDGKELSGRLLRLARGDRADLLEIGQSAGGQKLRVLEVRPRGRDAAPTAILVVGNPSGSLPLASLAAIELAAAALAAESGPAAAVHWYVIPLANPDGLDRFFERPRADDGRNLAPVDDDHDGDFAEDPPDDLDRDGLITDMLVPDPVGRWFVDPVTGVARRARPTAGEPGGYRRETEGWDEDGDGRLNEDARGGVITDRNLPHRFSAWTTGGGRWAGDQPESRALLEFAFAHPEIAMVLVLDASNTLVNVPTADPDPPSGRETVRVPGRLARQLGLDPDREHPLEFVLKTAEEARGEPLDPARVRAMLALGPVGHPDTADLEWWREAAAQYATELAVRGLIPAPRLAPAPLPPGSVAEWAYFQLGTVTFAADLWSVPLPAIADTATAVGGTAGPDTMDTADPELVALQTFAAGHGGHGWRPWRGAELPDGTEVLVGGEEPGARRTPPPAIADSLLAAQIPVLLELARWVPVLAGVEVTAEARGEDVWEIEARVRNDGPVPYPTAQGQLCRRPAPVVLELTGAEILQDTARRTLAALPARGAGVARWLVRAEQGRRITVTASAPAIGSASGTVVLEAGGGRR